MVRLMSVVRLGGAETGKLGIQTRGLQEGPSMAGARGFYLDLLIMPETLCLIPCDYLTFIKYNSLVRLRL